MSSRRNRNRRANSDDDGYDARPARRNNNLQNFIVDNDDDEDVVMGGAHHESGSGETDGLYRQLSKNLVRYALACDFQRIPIRRHAFKEKFMADHPRAWKHTFAEAQEKLRSKFGMEMRELPVREKLRIEEKRKAAGSNAAPKSSDSYILVSILPAAFRTPSLIPPSHTPTAEAEATYTGFYTLVVTLILLHGGEITDPKLRKHLKRLNADTHLGSHKTADVITRMERHGYIVKKVEKDAYSAGDDDRNSSYLVGPRGKVELMPENVADFVRAVYGETTHELEKQISASLGTQLHQAAEAEDEASSEDEDEDM